MKKHYLLLIRIVLFLSFFTPFLLVRCSCAKKAEVATVDSTAVLVDTIAIVDTIMVPVVNNTNNPTFTLPPVKNDSTIVFEESIFEKILEKMIWPQTNVISGFGIAFYDTFLVFGNSSIFSTITFAFYLTVLLLILYFLKRERIKRDLIISILINTLILVPIIVYSFDPDIKWGFYLCFIFSLFNLILQIIYIKLNKHV